MLENTFRTNDFTMWFLSRHLGCIITDRDWQPNIYKPHISNTSEHWRDLSVDNKIETD
jgi:hypothetical protein